MHEWIHYVQIFTAHVQGFMDEKVTSLLCYLTRNEAWTNAIKKINSLIKASCVFELEPQMNLKDTCKMNKKIPGDSKLLLS